MKNNRKMKNKKTKTKNYYPTNNEKLQERSREYYKNLSEDEKILKNENKKRKYAKTEKEPNSDEVRGRKREDMRNYFHKKCVKSFN